MSATLDIAQLRTLVHVAELGSVSRAAERLGIAQPALSRQIRLMEAELNAPLFVRHGRGMTMTALGQRLLDPAGAILSGMDQIRQLAAGADSSFTGKVRIGMTPTVAEVAAVPLIRALRHAHPQLSLSITTAFSGHLLEWLKRNDLDCCVTYQVDNGALVRTRAVLDEKLLLVGNAASAFAMSTPHEFASLANRKLILPSPAHGLRSILDACAQRAGITLAPALEVDSLSATVDLVLEGFGATILPLAPIHRWVSGGELTVAPLADPAPVRKVMMGYPLDRPTAPAARFAGTMFVSIAQELVTSGIWAGRTIGGLSDDALQASWDVPPAQAVATSGRLAAGRRPSLARRY